jgi:ribulose-phosphate 3-epimerase
LLVSGFPLPARLDSRLPSSRRRQIGQVAGMTFYQSKMSQIVPAILTRDINDYERKLRLFEKHSSRIHIDFADGKFVANKTLLPAEIANIRSTAELEAHLMVQDPLAHIPFCKQAGFAAVTFHFEATDSQIEQTGSEIHKAGMQAGLALNPATPVEAVKNFLPVLDYISVMSVDPGLQGNPFLPEMLGKLSELKKISPNVILQIDGGIKLGKAKKAKEAGAQFIVVGSAITHQETEEKMIEIFKQLQEEIAV